MKEGEKNGEFPLFPARPGTSAAADENGGDGCGRADRGDADRGSDCERNAKTRPHDDDPDGGERDRRARDRGLGGRNDERRRERV